VRLGKVLGKLGVCSGAAGGGVRRHGLHRSECLLSTTILPFTCTGKK
jgi:hypothetical protein